MYSMYNRVFDPFSQIFISENLQNNSRFIFLNLGSIYEGSPQKMWTDNIESDRRISCLFGIVERQTHCCSMRSMAFTYEKQNHYGT